MDINSKKNIVIAGLGYVGLSLAILFSKKHSVIVTDIFNDKIEKFKNGDYSFADISLQEYLNKEKTSIKALLASKEIYALADLIFIAVSTDFDENKGSFDTSQVEDVLSLALSSNKDASIVIRSTIPIGFSEKMREKYNTDRIIFNPEFLREGNALKDTLNPSRIIIGDNGKRGEELRDFILSNLENKDVQTLITGNKEAETIKLMSNTYLAMRIAFFNEVDILAERLGINSKDVIDGMGMDKRIGNIYNNPSFGFGGYCLPKDSKQASVQLGKEDGIMINSITKSNENRKEYISKVILNKNPKVVGIYHSSFKKGSNNDRMSAVIDIANYLKEKGIHVLIYEEELDNNNTKFEMTDDLNAFFDRSDIILANRKDEKLELVKDKVYTRDIYGKN